MTPVILLMMAAELLEDAPELAEALEDLGGMGSEELEGLYSRNLVNHEGELTRDGEIVLALIIAARGEAP